MIRVRSCGCQRADENAYVTETRSEPPPVAKCAVEIQNGGVFKEGQLVRVNLAGMQAGGVLFHAAVTDAIGNIVRQTSTNPSTYLVHLVFSFKGVSDVEVPEERIRAA